MKYENISVFELCFYLIDRCDLTVCDLTVLREGNYYEFSRSEMHDFIKEKTDNFDKVKFDYFITDIREFLKCLEPQIGLCPNGNIIDNTRLLPPPRGYMSSSHIKSDKLGSLFEKINFPKKNVYGIYEDVKKPNKYKLVEFSDIAEAEYKRVTESTPAQTEPTLKGMKRPNNTHGQQFALLEKLGIISFLKTNYNLPDTKMSELIANILNKDIQNTRTMLSLTGTKSQESNLPKNLDIVNEIMTKTGAIQED